MGKTYNVLKRLRRRIRNRTEKAISDFDMIQPGDRILIGVSGGSDSLALLQMFYEGFPHLYTDFTYIAAYVDPGFGTDSRPLKSHLDALGVPLRVVKSNIASQALDPDAKKNPCFICSLYRRREIYRIAHQEKCNKIAYGHHKDDIVETLLLNILFGRKIETMQPVQEIFQGNMFVIRPFTYIDEDLLKQFARELRLPVFPRHCPMDGQSRRDKIKQMIKMLQREEKNANIKENIFNSFYHVNMQFPPKRGEKR